MSAPGKRNITVISGDDYSHTITITDVVGAPIDVSARSYRAEIATDVDGTSPAAATFTIDDTDAATGVLVLSLTDTVTDALAVNGRYYWDLEEAGPSGALATILAGRVFVQAKVTH